MPELPEVETVKNQLIEAHLIGQTILEAHFFWPNTLRGISPKTFSDQIVGQKIAAIVRRGKYLIIRFENHDLIIHLRMTGQFHIQKMLPPIFTHERVYLKLSDSYLFFHDVRKFGTWQLAKDYQKHLDHLGPEPLSTSFNISQWIAKLQGSKTPIKPKLLDQTCLVGIGNIYADESLWLSHIHPTRLAASLKKEEIALLYQAIVDTLQRAIQNNGSSLGSGKGNFKGLEKISGKYQFNFNVYQKTQKPCPRCQQPIQKIKFHGRSTHFCSFCQK